MSKYATKEEAIEANRAKTRENYYKNKEIKLKLKKEYYDNNRETILQRQREIYRESRSAMVDKNQISYSPQTQEKALFGDYLRLDISSNR
jgi:hypothetical protein